MKVRYKHLIFSILFLAIACGKEPPVTEDQPGEAPAVDRPEEWHDKIRALPYPKISNELIINPAPLIVPQSMKTGKWLQFALSFDRDFPEDKTLYSDTLSWNMFNPHEVLTEGTWYWRYRNIDADGAAQQWSEAIPFEVTSSASRFVTPDFKAFQANLPTAHPRLWCCLDPYLAEAKANSALHEEYRELRSRANTALNADYDALLSPFSESGMQTLEQYIDYLYQFVLLTDSAEGLSKLDEVLNKLISRGFSDAELFSSNFCSSYIATAHIECYDLLYDSLSGAQRDAVERLLMRVLRRYFAHNCGYEENHIFDNHFWQHNMRAYFQALLCLWDKAGYEAETAHMLEYYYELWTARAPATGFNRDGGWINGTGYFDANVMTLVYMPLTLGYISGADFLQHPWYQNAGRAVAWSWAPSSASSGFGDNSEKDLENPTRQRVAFADFLARECGDAFAGWYASSCKSVLLTDYRLRHYRMCRNSDYSGDYPADAPKMLWYKDMGEVVMHSSLSVPSSNTSVSFRSATFGSGSHTLADQNSFNILRGGEPVFYHSGYYTAFSDAHNLLSYRHTRAHNSLLVNGMGQPFSTAGYGMLLRADGGSHIAYCLGDASQAYCGVSEDPMWVTNFEAAGVEQSAENGFGQTPLTKFRRQVVMLYPDIVLIYDELEASELASWDWLLHSPYRFNIGGVNSRVTVETGLASGAGSGSSSGGSAAAVNFFSSAELGLSRTNEFFSPPQPASDYAKQWHFTARASDVSALRILAVIRLGDSLSGLPALVLSDAGAAVGVTVTGSGSAASQAGLTALSCGNWSIEVALDPSSAEHLTVRDGSSGAVYSYGSDSVEICGSQYRRTYRNSSVLYDIGAGGTGQTDGGFSVSELCDVAPISTKTLH